MAHRSRYLALLSFGLRDRLAHLCQVTINDDGVCAHVAPISEFDKSYLRKRVATIRVVECHMVEVRYW